MKKKIITVLCLVILCLETSINVFAADFTGHTYYEGRDSSNVNKYFAGYISSIKIVRAYTQNYYLPGKTAYVYVRVDGINSYGGKLSNSDSNRVLNSNQSFDIKAYIEVRVPTQAPGYAFYSASMKHQIEGYRVYTGFIQ